MPNKIYSFWNKMVKKKILILREDFFVNGEFGTSNGPVFLQNISCTGNENDISGCLLNWKVKNCTDRPSVGVRCGMFKY